MNIEEFIAKLGISLALVLPALGAVGYAFIQIIIRVFDEKIKTASNIKLEEYKKEFSKELEDYKKSITIDIEKLRYSNTMQSEIDKWTRDFVKERGSRALECTNELHEFAKKIREEVEQYRGKNITNMRSIIIDDINRKYKNDFMDLTMKYHSMNYLYSTYAVHFAVLLNPRTINNIMDGLQKQNSGNIIYIYRMIWICIVSALRSVDEVSIDGRIWNKDTLLHENADNWAKYDSTNAIAYLKNLASTSGDRPNPSEIILYRTTLQESGGVHKIINNLDPYSNNE